MNMIEDAFTLPSACRDFVEWHLGRSPYLFWAIDLDTPAVRQRIDRAARQLAGLLLDAYRRQPHVTLDVCGFPCDAPEHPDDFSPALLRAQCAALRAAQLGSFAIEIGGLASFSSAPYLTLADPGEGFAAVRACLAVEGANRLCGDFTPHLTVGLYADAWPASLVNARLASLAAAGALRCRVERISLMSYAPAEIGGPLSRLGCFHLAPGTMHWHDAADRHIPRLRAAFDAAPVR